jgi:hypothetical protein
MSININHNSGKISTSDKDLKLDAEGVDNNISAQTNRIVNVVDPIDDQDAVTKIFLETRLASVDGGNDADSAELLEIIKNVSRNTYVESVDFVADKTAGGAGLVVTLTITPVGNPTGYTISWGDGQVQLNITSNGSNSITVPHTYATNSGSPYDVQVNAYNSNGTGAGSVTNKLREDYIVISTADPEVSFAVYNAPTGGNAITQWDDSDTVYFENTATNTSGATVQYTWDWGDGSADDVVNSDSVAGGVGGGRIAHTFALSTETDVQRTVTLSLDSHNTANPALLPLTESNTYKLFDTHSPEFTSDIITGINEQSGSGLPVIFTNNSEVMGSYAIFGSQFRWNFGDGTITTVNADGTERDGDIGQTIYHKFTLPESDQENGISKDYSVTLQSLTGHSNSPFTSATTTIHVEPDVRAYIDGRAEFVSDRNGDNDLDLYDGVDYNGNNRALARVDNSSHNGDSHFYDWGYGGTDTQAGTGIITHDFTGATPGSYELDFTVTGTPDITAQTDNTGIFFQVNAIPAAPSGLSSKTISLTDPAQGHSPRLAHGFTENSASAPLVAGASLETTTARRYTSGNLDTSVAQNSYNGLSGTVKSVVNGVDDGSQNFTTSLNENGTFGSLVVSDQRDANDSISSSTYPTGFYQTFDAKISKPFSEYTTGVNDQRIEHSETGNTNYVTVVCDDLTSTPTIDVTSATLTESAAGSYRYISGIPYYNTGNPQLTMSGVTVNNWIGQAYRDTNNVFEISNGTNTESTSGATISTQYKSYSDLENTPYLNAGIPTANTLTYQYADQTIDITNSSIAAVETLKVRAHNVNGTGNFVSLPEKVQVHTASPFGIIESSIPVESSLGNGVVTDNAIRIANFVADSTDTPTIVGSTDYTATPFTGAVGVSGSQEATVRWGVLKHDTTDYSTGYLPVGPDRSSDTGTQYFTFAFRRQVVANFDISINSTGIAGMWIAAPGTGVDNASGLNGWLECTSQYAGAGVPGSDTANGGNGANGCALTGADVVPTGSSINSSYTMTLGAENMSNATNNVVLVRIAIASGKQINSLSIGEAN